tara:strand:+ start:147 stop:1031 length:885 start_codon:yes stop_codon:yes gene_type:complete
MADRSGYIGRAPSDSSVTIARQTNTLTSTQSTFVFNSGYDVGYLDVYINGTKLINATDYQATDGQNVTLTVAGISGDVIEFVAYKAFNLSTVIAEATDLNVTGSFTVNNSAVVESLTAGDNISLSGSNGDVTITGLAATDRIVAESLVVSGVSTFSNAEVPSDSDKILLGAGKEMQVFHNGTDSVIKDTRNSGSVKIQADSFSVIDKDASETMLSATADGNVELKYDGSTKIQTLASGARITGDLDVSGVLTYEDVTNVDSIGVVTARSGIVATGIVTATEFDGQTELRTWLFG